MHATILFERTDNSRYVLCIEGTSPQRFASFIMNPSNRLKLRVRLGVKGYATVPDALIDYHTKIVQYENFIRYLDGIIPKLPYTTCASFDMHEWLMNELDREPSIEEGFFD